MNYSQRHLAENAWIKGRIQEGVIGRPVMVLSSKIDTIIGDRGMIHLESQGRRVECWAEAGGEALAFTGPATADEVDGQLEGAFRTSLEQFVRYVREGLEPETSAARTLHVTETQLAILEAARSGLPVAAIPPA